LPSGHAERSHGRAGELGQPLLRVLEQVGQTAGQRGQRLTVGHRLTIGHRLAVGHRLTVRQRLTVGPRLAVGQSAGRPVIGTGR